MKLIDVKPVVFDRVCLYDVNTLNSIWEGYIKNCPEKYFNSEVKLIGAKSNGVVDIGITLHSCK